LSFGQRLEKVFDLLFVSLFKQVTDSVKLFTDKVIRTLPG
jgi:hypothetical protein